MAWTVWNPSDIGTAGTLSNGNLTLTTTSVGCFARAVDGYALGTAAKYYFEISGVGSFFSTFSDGAGIATVSATYAQMQANATNGATIQPDAAVANRVFINGTNLYTDLVSPTPVLACIAIDLGAKLWWSKPTATGGFSGRIWNNQPIGTADPAAGIGGFDLSSLGSAAIYPYVMSQGGVVESFVANFGQNAFSGTVPSGFTAGWPGSGPALPTGLHKISATFTSILMGWTQGGGVTPDSYQFQYRKTGTSTWTQVTIAGPGPATSYNTTGLTSATNYDFQVGQTVAGVFSGYSSTVVASTLTPTVPVPPLPQALSNVPHATGGIYRGQVGINYNGLVLIGDAFAGVVGKMDFDNFTEYGNTMQGLIVAPPIHDDRKRIFLSRFELDVETGVGLPSLETVQGVQPLWVLDWSKDGGRTFGSPQLFRSMGRVGQYLYRMRWLRLGNSRQWLLRLRSTDPVRRVIIGTYVDVTKGVG